MELPHGLERRPGRQALVGIHSAGDTKGFPERRFRVKLVRIHGLFESQYGPDTQGYVWRTQTDDGG